ncbi:hypothetical protein FACS189446_0410 [Bacteroidia bacterium]|nr:hypothetical protein FACS189446_0410 [Bacteroidia bacterium]
MKAQSVSRYLSLTLLLTLVYELVLSFQGFDLCDEGAALTFSQQIYKCPDSVRYYFVYYLGGFVGGIWNILFGWGGILSFRIFTVITLVLTVYFTCLSLGKLVRPVVIPVATFFVLLMSNFGIMVFFHDYLTALFVAVSVYFLLKGLNESKFMYLFWAAFFCGINIFTRIPNITMLALGLLLFVDYSYEKNARRLGLNILSCLAGVWAGVVLVFLLMLVLGHWEIFLQATGNLFSKGTGSDSPHNLTSLLWVYAGNYKNIYITMSVFVFTVFFLCYMYNSFKHQWLKIVTICCFAGMIIYFILFAFNNEKYYGIILFPLLISCFVDRRNKPITLLNCAALIVMFFLPLGSDIGVLNMGYFCVWPATFASVFHVYRFIRSKMGNGNRSYRVFFLIFGLLYGVYGLYVVARNAYSDRGPRWEKRFRADNDKFTVFTSEAKAQAMDELLSELKKHVRKDDYLFCYESLPMIHYLTETKPYTGNPWVWVYDSESFKRNLDLAVAHIPLPVVLRQKCQPIGGYWTVPVSMNVQDYESKGLYDYYYKQGSLDYFEKFLHNNQYQVVWENNLFTIYLVR